MDQIKILTVNGVSYALTDASKLPLPQSAAAGQFLVAAEVDGSGTVTAVAAVDDPTAGVEEALDGILAIQEALIGGAGA